MREEHTPTIVDYVVVGAGSAGCVLAARLSESGAHQVALLEAGGEDKSFWIHAPLGFGKLYDDPKYNWLFESEPEAELANARQFLPRGKVLGGTSSINGMIYSRGQRRDFDHWQQLGNAGWGYDDVEQYFTKAEDNELGAGKHRGAGGPLRVSNIPRNELADAFINAGLEAGYSATAIDDGAHEDGFGYNQLTIRDGRRCSTAVAYLHPVRKRKNLSVIVESLATKVLFRGRDAVGVEYTRNGVTHKIMARREVIVSGGAFNSPQLLQLSGIGPRELLEKHGVPVIEELPGVGANLQDHFGFWGSYRCTRPITVNDVINNPLRRLGIGVRYVLFRSGLMALNPSFVAGCIRTHSALSAPDVKLNLTLWCRSTSGRAKERFGLQPFSAFSVFITLQHPEARGTVRIKSGNPADPPEIRFNFFASEGDRKTSVAALRGLRKVMAMPAITPYVAAEIAPGPQLTTDAELTEYVRQNGRTNHHPSSTCKMGTDAMAVVDPRLRVRGVNRLRVVDASIMPRIVAGNPNATIVMIAEKASAMLLEDAAAMRPLAREPSSFQAA
jgi:choline dehydrogenase